LNDTLIIGAGPAGLTAAYELSKLGCHATILEAGEQVATAKTLPQQVVEEAFAELDGVALGIALGLCERSWAVFCDRYFVIERQRGDWPQSFTIRLLIFWFQSYLVWCLSWLG